MLTVPIIIERYTLLFARLRKEAVIPTKSDENMGWDIYACFDDDAIMIMPGETVMVPTGIASVFHEDFGVILEERGSTGTKGMKKSSGVIDSSYRGEWMAPIYNSKNIPIIIAKPDIYKKLEDVNNLWNTPAFLLWDYRKAICQAVFHEIPKMEPMECTPDVIQHYKTERGTGKLGSSGK